MLLEKIKNKIKNKKKKKIEVGDLVWAYRYKNEEEKNKIEESHREGPFLIIYKKWFTTYALYSTSSFKNFKYQNSYLEVNAEKYNLDKTTYVIPYYLNKIKKKQIIKTLNKIDMEDLNYVKKLVYLALKNKKKSLINYYKIKFIIDVGDIIIYQNKYYYIYNKDDNYYYANKVHKVNSMQDRRVIKVGVFKYKFNFDNDIKIPITNKVYLTNTINLKKQQLFTIYKEDYLKEKEMGIDIKRGSLIKHYSFYYYVYGEYQDNYLTYRVYLTKSTKGLVYEIKIAGKKYYTSFEKVMVFKESYNQLISDASDLEIDVIKSLKKEMKLETKNTINYLLKSIMKGSIIASVDSDLKYIVYKRSSNTLYCVDYYDREKEVTLEITKDFPYILVDKLTYLELQNLMINLKRLGLVHE